MYLWYCKSINIIIYIYIYIYYIGYRCIHYIVYVLIRLIPYYIYIICHIYIYICVFFYIVYNYIYMAVCQNLVPLVNIKIAGKWMFIPLKMVLMYWSIPIYLFNLTPETAQPQKASGWSHKPHPLQVWRSIRDGNSRPSPDGRPLEDLKVNCDETIW